MRDHHKPDLITATADDILAVLRDQHRQQCSYDPEADPDIELSHASTIDEWRQACDLIAWRPLAKAMNEIWGIEVPLSQWQAVLVPPRKRPLGDVCRLLADNVRLPRVRPAKMLGSNCTTAGAFLTVRTYLAEAGVDVRKIAPSTSLAPYTRDHLRVFLGPVSRLAPGAIPLVAFKRRPVVEWILAVFLISLALTGVGACTGVASLESVPALVALVSFVAAVVAVNTIGPPDVQFGTLRTFRDLAVALTDRTPA
jgi:hypothetical protein